MKRKGLAIGLTVSLLGGLLAGCATEQEGATGSSSTAPSAQKPVKLEFAMKGAGLPKPEEDFMKKALDSKLNMDMNITLTATNDYPNQLNVRLAAGNFPDVFEASGPAQIKEFADKGLILDLTPYLEKLKPVIQFQEEGDFKKGNIAGKQYAIIRDSDVPFDSFWIREDWLAKLNLKVPANLDELLQVAKAFTNNDPDGNGKKDTIGITGFDLAAFKAIFGAYGVGSPGDLYVKNGKLIDGVQDPNMKPALEYIKKLFDEGVVDTEFVTNKNNADTEKAFQGKAGIFYKGWTSIARTAHVEQYKAINPNASWIQMKAPAGPDGKSSEGSYNYGKASNYFVVSKSVEKDPAKIQKIIDLFNYLTTEEGLRLAGYGLEGKHYNVQNGKIVPTALLDKEGAWFYLYQLPGRREMEYLMNKFGNIAKEIQFAIDQPRIKALNGYIYEFPAGYKPADATRYINEEMIKFLYGKRPLTEYDQFLKTLNDTFGYNRYVETAEKQLSEKGLLK